MEPQPRLARGDHGRGGDRDRGSRRVLRVDRRRPRHHPESPAPGDGAGRDGGAGLVQGRRRARREIAGPALDARHLPRRHQGPRRARPVRGLSQRAGRCAGLAGPDLHGHPLHDRQLAVGGRAVLHARGQEARRAQDGDRDLLQERAARAVQERAGGGGAAARRADADDPAARGHLATLRREGARREHHDRQRADDDDVCRCVQAPDRRGLRAAPDGLHPRRRDAVQPA